MRKVSEKIKLSLMAGFTACNDKGELVLLGRNGSDYSAACLAALFRRVCLRNLD